MGGISAKCDPLGAHPQRTIEMATRNGDQNTNALHDIGFQNRTDQSQPLGSDPRLVRGWQALRNSNAPSPE